MVDVMVMRLRQRLAPYGVKITTQWGCGYFIDKESAALLAGLRVKEAAPP